MRSSRSRQASPAGKYGSARATTANVGDTSNPSEASWRLWSLSRGHSVIWLDELQLPGASPKLLASLKATLTWLSENYSTDHVRAVHSAFTRFFRTLEQLGRGQIDQISAATLANFRSAFPDNDRVLLHLRPVLTKWSALGHEGISADAIAYLKAARLRKGAQGVAVLTLDPTRGPLSDVEVEALQQAITEGFAKGAVSLSEFVAAWIFLLLGTRPVQVAAMRVKDVTVTSSQDSKQAYGIQVPRAKQRGARPRMEFRYRRIIPQVGELLRLHAEEVRARFEGILRDPREAPLFPAKAPNPSSPRGFEWHQSAIALAAGLQRRLALLAPPSERTGRPIHITMLRFRHTLGTRAAIEGHGTRVIAELLDHSDQGTVQVYVEARPEFAEIVDRAMAFQMAPLARAFAGDLGGVAPGLGRRVSYGCADGVSRAPVGCCGTTGECSLAAPVACYTCKSFHAWLDGPHDSVLDRLLSERERLLKETDPRIASINDRTILAVAEVIQACRQTRRGRQDG